MQGSVLGRELRGVLYTAAEPLAFASLTGVSSGLLYVQRTGERVFAPWGSSLGLLCYAECFGAGLLTFGLEGRAWKWTRYLECT